MSQSADEIFIRIYPKVTAQGLCSSPLSRPLNGGPPAFSLSQHTAPPGNSLGVSDLLSNQATFHLTSQPVVSSLFTPVCKRKFLFA